jgi:transposase-like protein
VNRGGRPRIKPTPAHLVLVRSLYWDKGQSLRRVATVMGVSAPTLRSWMRKNGIPLRHSGWPGPPAGSLAVLARCNARRTREAAPETSRRLQSALAVLGDQAPPLLAAAARLRITHPGDSLNELAARAGVTKDAIAGRLRRLLDLAARQS